MMMLTVSKGLVPSFSDKPLPQVRERVFSCFHLHPKPQKVWQSASLQEQLNASESPGRPAMRRWRCSCIKYSGLRVDGTDPKR